MIATERIPFSGYHMPFPAVGYVERTDLGYRYVAGRVSARPVTPAGAVPAG